MTAQSDQGLRDQVRWLVVPKNPSNFEEAIEVAEDDEWNGSVVS